MSKSASPADRSESEQPHAAQRVVFMSRRDEVCAMCAVRLSRGDMIEVKPNSVLCLACAGLGKLEFLACGDAALTRRAQAYSAYAAVVLEWSSSRKRSERQGVLVEPGALARAREDCQRDEGERARHREGDRKRRAKREKEFVEAFARKIQKLYPYVPEEIPERIAEHACEISSGRVGRSAGAKTLELSAITLAVRAWVRHNETNYDALLAANYPRDMARELVDDKIERVLEGWSAGA
jgi:hypothetical protein